MVRWFICDENKYSYFHQQMAMVLEKSEDTKHSYMYHTDIVPRFQLTLTEKQLFLNSPIGSTIDPTIIDLEKINKIHKDSSSICCLAYLNAKSYEEIMSTLGLYTLIRNKKKIIWVDAKGKKVPDTQPINIFFISIATGPVRLIAINPDILTITDVVMEAEINTNAIYIYNRREQCNNLAQRLFAPKITTDRIQVNSFIYGNKQITIDFSDSPVLQELKLNDLIIESNIAYQVKDNVITLEPKEKISFIKVSLNFNNLDKELYLPNTDFIPVTQFFTEQDSPSIYYMIARVE